MNDIYVTITEITAYKICGKFYDSENGRQMLKEVLIGLIRGHFGNTYAEDQYNSWERLNLSANPKGCEETFNITSLV